MCCKNYELQISDALTCQCSGVFANHKNPHDSMRPRTGASGGLCAPTIGSFTDFLKLVLKWYFIVLIDARRW